ncbi:MAG: hypothetical protein ABIH23_35165 [bacterium]
MQLTEERKAYIDGLDVNQLLSYWRFAEAGDPWFQDETGEYWGKRLAEKRGQDNAAYVRASKNIG